MPKGVSAETWAALKVELKRLLLARSKDGKAISIAPAGSLDAVTDLAAVSTGAGTQATLTWTEVLPGDYDNDGEVYITDLIPVALYYGQRTDSGPDDAHKLVNGDADPVINEGDLVAIATNYGAHLEGYQVWRGHWNGTSTDWEATARPNPNAANPDWSADRPSPPPVSVRPTYTFSDDISALTDKANIRYKVTPYGDGAPGAESNEATLSPPVGLADSPWPKFRGNAKNTGLSPYVGAQTGNLLWSSPTGGYLDQSSPSIGPDGTIYVCSTQDYLVFAVSPSDGSLKWTFTATAWIQCTPTISADGTLYIGVARPDKRILALNSLDGSIKWQHKTSSGVSGSCAAIGRDGTVYIGSYDNCVYALNPSDGTVIRKFQMGNYVESSPAISDDGILYVGCDDGKVYAFNSTDGTQKWTYQTGGTVTSSPAIGPDGTVYIGSVDKCVYALKGSDGTVRWQYTTGGMVGSSVAIGPDGTVYVGSRDGDLYALSPSDGTLKWQYASGSDKVLSSPAVGADGTVYFCANNYVFALNGAKGILKWSYYTDGTYSSPAIGADGTVYAAAGPGTGVVQAFSP